MLRSFDFQSCISHFNRNSVFVFLFLIDVDCAQSIDWLIPWGKSINSIPQMSRSIYPGNTLEEMLNEHRNSFPIRSSSNTSGHVFRFEYSQSGQNISSRIVHPSSISSISQRQAADRIIRQYSQQRTGVQQRGSTAASV